MNPTTFMKPLHPGEEPDWAELERITESLPYSDGKPLESLWHFLSIVLLRDVLTRHWRDRNDFFVGGDMFLYYSLIPPQNPDLRGPDFFYVKGVDRHRPRKKWVVWAEDGKYPNLIIELPSCRTAQIDRTVKKDLYEQIFRTSEYFLFDPDGYRLEGWHFQDGRYTPIVADERGWMWSEELQLWLGRWAGKYQQEDGIWLRCYDNRGTLVLTAGEAAALLADQAKQRADQAKQRADQEKQRAEQEKQRADTFEVENARLIARLAELEKNNPPSPQ